jgi:deoxyadenosine/deoxycytidine kinase
MEASYLRRLGNAYDDYFFHYQGPLHIIQAADYDFVENKRDQERLVGDILQLAKVA